MDYYFDSRRGDNANAGTSAGQAWRDFSNINGRRLAPGDRLLLRRGSHFRGQLSVAAVGTAARWVEITAYGEGPRPVVEGRSTGGCGQMDQSGPSLDETAPCIYLTDAGFLRVSGLTVYRAFFGLVINCFEASRSDIVVEDVVAYDIQNFGQHEPRVNSAGIEIAVGRGHACTNVTLDRVTVRNCECYRTGTGFAVRAFGDGCRVRDVTMQRITAHDNADTPWSYVGLFIHHTTGGVFEGVCLDGCAPHWKHTGTATVHHIRSDDITFRDSYVARTQDTDSHDMGGWDFESGGDGCRIERCTFVDNAGPAIEFLLTTRTIQNAEIARCTFIHNDWTRWGGACVIHTGRTGEAPTGFVHDNHYVLAPGTVFCRDERLKLADNREYPEVSALPAYLTPPTVDAGADCTITELALELSGRVANATTHRWEAIIAPGDVNFDDPGSVDTTVRFSRRGTYVLRLVAENEHFIYGDYVTLRCVADPDAELIARWRADRAEVPAELAPVDPGRTFSIRCRVRLDGADAGTQTLVANTVSDPVADGFKLCVNRCGTADGTVFLETGNGADTDTAYSRPGVLTPGAWHDLVATVDATSRDTRGHARFYVDGRDVTLEPLIRSDLRTAGLLTVGRMPTGDAAVRPTPPVQADEPRDAFVPGDFERVFADDFTDGLTDDWSALQGEWHVADGWLAGQGKGEILCTRKFPHDVLLVYDACADDEPGDLSATLNATRENGPMFGYFFGFGTDDNRCSRLIRRTGPLAEADARITPGTVHRVGCLRQGRTLRFIVDGAVLIEHEERRPIPAGRQPYLALYVHRNGRFGRVRVYAPRPRPAGDYPLIGRIDEVRLYPRVLSARAIAHQAGAGPAVAQRRPES